MRQALLGGKHGSPARASFGQGDGQVAKGNEEKGCLRHPIGWERCFFVVTGSTASGNTDTRKWLEP